MSAIEQAHLEMVRYLVKLGAKIHKNKRYAVSWALRNKYIEAATIILVIQKVRKLPRKRINNYKK